MADGRAGDALRMGGGEGRTSVRKINDVHELDGPDTVAHRQGGAIAATQFGMGGCRCAPDNVFTGSVTGAQASVCVRARVWTVCTCVWYGCVVGSADVCVCRGGGVVVVVVGGGGGGGKRILCA